MSGTVLGFDHGHRRIGVAVGQTVTGTARPLTTLRCGEGGHPDWPAVEELIRQWGPDALVVGRPCHADGSDSDSTRASDRFSRQLEGRFRLPVHRVDERLSSVEARDRLRATGRPGTRQNKEAVDMMAACIILETWLTGA